MMEKLALPFFARIHFAKRFSQTLKYHSWYPFGLGFLEIHFGKTPRCVQLLAKGARFQAHCTGAGQESQQEKAA